MTTIETKNRHAKPSLAVHTYCVQTLKKQQRTLEEILESIEKRDISTDEVRDLLRNVEQSLKPLRRLLF